MPTWRCPHCGTPQAESSRCWVCKRSSTSCGTCRHFRRAIAGHLGYCGLDRQRQPLRGDELRGCWEARPGEVEHAGLAAGRSIGPSAPEPDRRPRLEFVAVESLGQPPATAAPSPELPAVPAPPVTPAPDPLLGFWADDV